MSGNWCQIRSHTDSLRPAQLNLRCRGSYGWDRSSSQGPPAEVPPHYSWQINERNGWRNPLFSEMSRNSASLPPTTHCTSPSAEITDSSFFSDQDRHEFLALLDHHADLRQVMIHGHAHLFNHFHLVVTGQVPDGVSRFMQHLTGQAICPISPRPPELRRAAVARPLLLVRFGRAPFLDRAGLRRPQPVRARLVGRAEGYAWSSATAHCGVAPPADWLDLMGDTNRMPPR